MQKNRCPFFFFEGRVESLFTLSLSEMSRPSSSSPISISCESTDWVDLCEFSLLNTPFWPGVLATSREGVKGVVGRGRCPEMPMKLLRVGVFAEGSSARGSSARVSSTGLDSEKN